MSRNSQRLSSVFSGFFFKDADPRNLGICRFLFYGIILCLYLERDFSQWAKVPDVLWHPIFIFDFFRIPVLSADILGFLGVLWLASLLLSALGFLTRPSTACSFLVGFYLLGMENSFAKTHHMESLMLVIFCVLCFSRCGDGFSLDAVFKRKYGWWPFGPSVKRSSPAYRWPVRLIWVMVMLVFCAAGISKLRNPNLEWITSEYMSTLFINKGLAGDRVDPLIGWLPLWLGSKVWLSSSLAGVTVLLESCAPLALVSRHLRMVIVPGLFFMLLGFGIIIGTPFPQWLATFVFWVPWNDLAVRRLGLSRE